ncbi:hypothetical protein [Phenylobacterium sp.]|jgi:hypothetical protein|uniref:hypothetical protein n=1 Tax=Phenylobacterium sp. TaxID=1871053 RepID=UPI002E2F424C|nr:hypothetical protein [Phenylobacterium sp.]HEX2562135.1 hypothetical protein [Phenylobacterium sp.]
MPPAQSARTAPPRKRGTVAAHFRDAIGKALEEGSAQDDMILRLTLSDFSELKRDHSVAVEDISFKGGEMRYLGVKVTGGGVDASRLDLASA